MADDFVLLGLKKHIIRQIKDNDCITVQNCVSAYELARRLDIESVKECACKCVADNLFQVSYIITFVLYIKVNIFNH